MSSVTAVQVTVPTYNIETVQKIVAETTNQITVKMVEVLIKAVEQKNSFVQLADKHTIKDLTETLNKSDQKTQDVYQKLFKATLEHIQKNSTPLMTCLSLIVTHTKNETADGQYLGSFVFNAVGPMITKLQTEQPGAVEDAEIWK